MTKPVRVLHIVTYMGRGGLESMIMNYYRHMDRSQVQFDFLVHRDFEADYDQEILSLGGKIYHVSRLVPWSRRYQAELKQFFKNHPEYKIVHVHQDCLSSVALKCAKECGVPVRIAHAHSNSAVKNLKYPIKSFYKKKISKYATQLFACSKQAGKWMFCGSPFTVITNAIDVQSFQFSADAAREMRTALNIQNQFVIGHVGRFRPEKNHSFLIDIFSQIVKTAPDSILLLIGDGELQAEIVNKVNYLGLSNNVCFLGSCANVNQLLQAIDVFVFPSLYEGLGISVLEAQAAGLPCIISSSIPKDCLVTNLVTQMSLQESPERWAAEILMHRNHHHEDTSSQICNATFDITENSNKLQEFYIKALEGTQNEQ